jgi:pimeloyl-ACP methyl ester carboxylesterase
VKPETRYARSGDVNIAYGVLGDGPRDLVLVLGWVTHVEYIWEDPSAAAFLSRLASFSRLILFDKRGTGLSDRVPNAELPTLEQRMDDVRAVMDAAGSEQAALMGVSEGGPMCLLFAATYPVRRELDRFRGREIDTTGDGFLATFDGPARAIRCATAIRDGVHSIGLAIRAGLHTGECELHAGRVAGIAVHTGARVAAMAGPDEVLVSSTVKDLVAGSGIEFEDRDLHQLKGVPGSWRIYKVLTA